MLRSFQAVRRFCSCIGDAKTMKYLNVAEKNDAAKTIAGHLSNGTSNRRESLSPYNKIYEYEYPINGSPSKMIMTSVSGHLLTHAFTATFKNWKSCDPIVLFDAPVTKVCPEDYVRVKKTLEREIKHCGGLIIWTDCDREGENIGFEIIDVCRAIKPNIRVYRAKFSEMTKPALQRAMANLIAPDELMSKAVDVRSELDLRIGAAFTRFQTMRLQTVFPEQIESLVSYGSCQIPTLGFVVQRYNEVDKFVAQPFWKIKVVHKVDDVSVEFSWARSRLFDRECCEAYYLLCQAEPTAYVDSVTEKSKSKWRPTPLDTVELEKLGSRKLRLTAKETMTIAEKLYSQGIISYPRTETNQFSKEVDLRGLVTQHADDQDWGRFAAKVLSWGPNPRNGRKSDQAHPPIHPTKHVTNLQGNERKVYELVVRHFLACVSRDAVGFETIVQIRIAGEEFSASGLVIRERNYLEVYPYDRWTAKEILNYERNTHFEPTEISMPEGSTSAPNLLTEADLIGLMEKHGIGTDATHAEHINTIKTRGYIGERDRYLVPGLLGMGLVEGYDSMNLPLAQPELRAELEADLKRIAEGRRNADEVLQEQIAKYREVYKTITERALSLDQSLGVRFNAEPQQAPVNNNNSVGNADGGHSQINTLQEVMKCPKCQRFQMILKKRPDRNTFLITCLGFPDCKSSVWFSDEVKEVRLVDTTCARCGTTKKLAFKFKNHATNAMFNCLGGEYTTCIVCDRNLREVLDIRLPIATSTTTGPQVPVEVRRNAQNNSASGGSAAQSSANTTRTLNTVLMSRPTTINPPANPPQRRNNNPNPAPQSSGRGWNLPATGNGNTNDNFGPGAGTSRGWGLPPSRDSGDSNSNRPNNKRRMPDDLAGEKCTGCNGAVKQLITRKEGPNQGRPFYVCAKPSNPCNFFKWADLEDNNRNAGGGGGQASGSGMQRQEYEEPGARGWGLEPSRVENNSGGGTYRGGGRGGARGSGRGSGGNDRTSSTRRKCGVCRQEGHTRNNCPNN